MHFEFAQILKDPKIINLLSSTTILLLALITYWVHPSRFHEHKVVERAFEFWVLKWMFYVVTWGLFNANTDLRFVLAANDFNTIVGLGIVISLWKGDFYDERHTLVNLVFLFGLLFAWNFVSYTLALPGYSWIFPSMTLSLIYISAAAFVIIARLPSAASILFGLMSLAYLFLQLPSYQIVFGKANPDPDLLRLLGLAKLGYGGLFYAAFFQPLKDIERSLTLAPRLPFLSDRLKNALSNPVSVAVLGGILTELILWLGKGAWHLITGRPV